MINFTVLGGYLGAGKTTLLNHLLKHNNGRRYALLINDFGDINIDAQLVESQDENQINLANGCVCCSLSDGYFDAIESLLARQPAPDHIIVEASGVANVHNLAQYGYGKDLRLAGVVVVADAETVEQKANDKYVAQTVRRQLQAADLIVLNKIDLCSADQVTQVATWLADIAPGVPVVRATGGVVPPAVLLSLQPDEEQHRTQLQGHEHYASWSYRSQATLQPEQLQQFMQQLPASVIRAKGIFQLVDGTVLELQVVGQRRELAQRAPVTQAQAVSQCVAIGLEQDFRPSQLGALADQLLVAKG